MSIHMPLFDTLYREAFASLGRPLSDRDALPGQDIGAAEALLGMRCPEALRSFHRVAGRATDFICHHDRFLSPGDWTLEAGKLCFMEENQGVVLYAAAVGGASPDDPAVFMSHHGRSFDWQQVCVSVSCFVQVMLCWEGVFGGAMSHTATSPAPPGLIASLRAWRPLGEVNDMRAWSQPGRALCLLDWSGEPRLFFGATSLADLLKIQAELGAVTDNEWP